MTLRTLVVSAVLFGATFLAHALDIRPYSASALAEAQANGRPVALHFHADWCPTCRAQERTLNALASERALDLTVLVANFDTERDLKRRFRVAAQSTLVVLRGTAERARVVGRSDAASLRAALQTAL